MGIFGFLTFRPQSLSQGRRQGSKENPKAKERPKAPEKGAPKARSGAPYIYIYIYKTIFLVALRRATKMM